MQYRGANGGITVTATTDRFHHQQTSEGGCDCPIHRGRERDPFTAPLGMAFADQVAVEPVARDVAAAIYAAHHSYMTDLPEINLTHYGLYFQDALVGAITYRYPLLQRKAVHYDDAGRLIPPPVDVAGELPAVLRQTARRIIPDISPADVAEREIVNGGAFVEAARICIGVRMPNLASATLARSMERFVLDHGHRDVRFLLTWVRADYDGAMIRALRDKGWTCVGYSEPSEAGNRDPKAIRQAYKWQFMCPLSRVGDQTTLEQWADAG